MSTQKIVPEANFHEFIHCIEYVKSRADRTSIFCRRVKSRKLYNSAWDKGEKVKGEEGSGSFPLTSSSELVANAGSNWKRNEILVIKWYLRFTLKMRIKAKKDINLYSR